MAQEIIERIKGVVTPILDSLAIELVDLELSGQGKRGRLRIYIDKAGGITMDQCEQASRYIGHALDVADPIQGAYTLEVSSPGLDRPFRRIEDYRRHVGKRIRIKMIQPREGTWTFIGRLQTVQADRVEIQPDKGEPVEIALADVAQARLEVEW